jgi:hypothetical protein
VRNQSILYRFVCTIHIVTCTLLITSHNHLFCSGVRNAAQRKLFDELGIVADELPVDQFILLGRMLYMAPSDGKWGEHECTYLITFLPSHPGFPVFILFVFAVLYMFQGSVLQLQALQPFLFCCFSGLPPVHGS